MQRDFIYQIELVSIVARKITSGCPSLANLINDAGLNHPVHEIGEKQIKGLTRMFAPENVQ
jgi:hypothetical protein